MAGTGLTYTWPARRTGRSAAWLARLLWEQEVPGSNPGAPIGILAVREVARVQNGYILAPGLHPIGVMARPPSRRTVRASVSCGELTMSARASGFSCAKGCLRSAMTSG